MAPRGKHSEKPEVFLQMIEEYLPNLPKIELNRRGSPRPGWARGAMKPNLQKRPPNDPAAGGFGVLTACLRLGREFVGCDIDAATVARFGGGLL
jgi:hypothetical protein